jgi:acetylornithine deacetylase/succinyl-diaminopimelate desuccinylase-like protein
MADTGACESALQDRRDRSLAELFDFLRIPSISALPEHAADVMRAAAWVAERLGKAGMERVRVMPTGGHPVVYGEWMHAPGGPTVLVYGHFDVQPADPVELWTSPPFEPTLREGRIYARGASDDKGNLLAPIFAIEAMLARTRKLPVNVKIFAEGQEEIGSPELPAFVAENRALLGCDVFLNADGGQWTEAEPLLLEGLRGLCSMEIEVRGPSSDLHSGSYGGTVANPLHALAELLAGLHAPDGRVTVAGFYDDVAVLDPESRRAMAAVPFDERAYLRDLGLRELHGEAGYSAHERTWVRPTLEVNGMWGGFQGAGTKTVLPREAHAKITCRLVPDQDPARVLGRLEAHFASRAPRGVEVSAKRGGALAWPFLVPPDLPATKALRSVLIDLYGREPYRVRSGGTVAVCGIALRELGVHALSFGFGLKDEHIHAPDEFFRLASFERAQLAYCRVLEELGRRS